MQASRQAERAHGDVGAKQVRLADFGGQPRRTFPNNHPLTIQQR